MYVCIYMGSVEVKVGKSFERFESLKFLRIFFSFSFSPRKQRCYLKFYMNELYIYIYQVIYEEMNFSWDEDINVSRARLNFRVNKFH